MSDSTKIAICAIISVIFGMFALVELTALVVFVTNGNYQSISVASIGLGACLFSAVTVYREGKRYEE